MGLLLQKTNITRDFIQDLSEERIFWPQQLLEKYAILSQNRIGNDANNGDNNSNNTSVNTSVNHTFPFLSFWKKPFVETTDDTGIKQERLKCLNTMICNSLKHLNATVDYLDELNSYGNKQIFQFCAIPQIMAVATLEKCFNNENVFNSEVKISKVLTAQIIAKSSTMDDVKYWYNYFLDELNNDRANACQEIVPLIDQAKDRLGLL